MMRSVITPTWILVLVMSSLAGCSTAPRPQPVAGSSQVASNEPGMYLQLIQRMQEQGAWFASLAHIQAYRQQHGDSPGLQLAEADALRNTGQPDQAASLYQGLTRGPLQAAAWHGLGLLAITAGQPEKAIAHLQLAARLSPLQATYLGDLGYAQLLAGQLVQARAPLAQAAELSPGDGRAVANLALWQVLNGKPQAAEQMMQRAGLPEASRQAVYASAAQLRRLQPQPAHGGTGTAAVHANRSMSGGTAAAQARDEAAMPTATPLPSSQDRASIAPPVSMLERFSTPPFPQQGSSP
jgi:Flp pilus assembly protein TadD